MPPKSSLRSSSVVFSGSKPLTKMRLLVSARPSCSHPAVACFSASFSALDLGALHFLHALRQLKLLFPHCSHCQSPPRATWPPVPAAAGGVGEARGVVPGPRGGAADVRVPAPVAAAALAHLEILTRPAGVRADVAVRGGAVVRRGRGRRGRGGVVTEALTEARVGGGVAVSAGGARGGGVAGARGVPAAAAVVVLARSIAPSPVLAHLDANRAPVDLRAAHAVDARPGLVRVREGDEPEPARAPGVAIGHHLDVHDLAEATERGAQAALVRVEAQVTHHEARHRA